MPLRVFVYVAITAQQFCSIETPVNLFVSDGISKTAVWRKQDELMYGTSQMRERSPYDMPVSTKGLRALFNQQSKQETQICASRRSPR